MESIETLRDARGIGEAAELGGACECVGAECDHRHGAEDHDGDADDQIEALVVDEARSDALVDDIALLEEQLPGRHGRADDRDHQQHHIREVRARRQLRDQEIVRDRRPRRPGHEEDRQEQHAAEYQREREALEPAEIPGAGRRHDERRRGDHPERLGYAQDAERRC